MEKEIEEIKNIVAIHFGALGFLNPSENEQILKDRDRVLNALTELKSIKESNPSEALEEIKQIEFYVGTIIGLKFIKGNDVFSEAKKQDYEIFEKKSEKIKQYILKAQENEKVLKIIKEKCLHNDNLNYVAICINYDMYKRKMSEKHDTKVIKTNWDDKILLDYLKLLTQDEFDLLKRWQNEITRVKD